MFLTGLKLDVPSWVAIEINRRYLQLARTVMMDVQPVTRREAARVIAAGTAGLLLPFGSSTLAAAGKGSSLIRRAVPKTGEKLPVMGLGSAVAFDVPNKPARLQPLEQVLALFVKSGGKVIDSSPMYGNAEEVIGKLAAQTGVARSLFIATKVWTNGRQQGIDQMEQSLVRFKTRKIDLMQVHNLADVDTHMGTLRTWKSQGRIRYTGITYSESSGHAEVERIMKSQRPDFVQINYSMVDRAADQRILPLAQQLGMGVIINRPFGGGPILGHLAGKPLPSWAAEFDCHSWAQFLLKWIIAHPAVTCVIPATANP
ncbi:MAG TPA: aldo/keto reductase, partial [Chthoniobacterales bacterium]|nr:aldo/keto reductase [Chthoniobacterales bacterium]